MYRSSRPEVFLRKSVLKICSEFTGEHTGRSVIPKNTSGRLLLNERIASRKILGNEEIQWNFKIERRHSLVPSLLYRNKNLVIALEN